MQLRTKGLVGTIEIEDAIFEFKEIGVGETFDIEMISTRNGKVNHGELMVNTFIRSCSGWKNVVGEDGEDLKCTKENRAAVAELNPAMVAEFVRQYSERIKEIRGTERKNS